MTFVERRASRLTVPWDEDTPDSRGFWQYVKSHFERADILALKIMQLMGWDPLDSQVVYAVVLDKLTSPLVYLYEAWCVMAPEKKARYNEELTRIHEEAKKLAEEAFKKE